MHKKKAKILVVGDAASGKSSLVQSYVKKNYQFSSDYIMVKILSYLRLKELNCIPKLYQFHNLTLMYSSFCST